MFLRNDFVDHVSYELELRNHGDGTAPARPSAGLPRLHKDTFDRMLVAQAMIEGLTLVTSDPAVVKYPGPIRLV